MIEGILASIGRVGDAYDNALAKSTIGLFETEAIRHGNPFHAGPFKNIDDIEYATMGWVNWYNNRRLHSTLDYVTPVEFELSHYATNLASQPEMSHTRTRQKSSNDSVKKSSNYSAVEDTVTIAMVGQWVELPDYDFPGEKTLDL